MAANSDTVQWSDLPKELWSRIAQHLNTTIDLLRFRSTCKSWRSSIPLPLPHPSSAYPLFAPQSLIRLGQFTLVQTKIYRLQLEPPPPSPHHHHDDPSISSSNKGWLIMVDESKTFPLCLLDPFTKFPAKCTRRSYPPPSGSFPKVLNLMNFRVIDLVEGYSLEYRSNFLSENDDEFECKETVLPCPVREVRKVVLFPSFEVEGRMVFALYKDGTLGVSKIGDENWTVLDDGNSYYDDMMLHKGQLYVVDKWGTILWVDCSSLKLVKFSPLLCGFGKRKHLVGGGGSFYVVDMYIEGDPDNQMGRSYDVVDIKVYRLDEEWGKWLDVKNLGDMSFVLGKDSNFSLSAQDYHGCEGNCIYFCVKGRACVFSLENSKFKNPYLFWPCPTLFNPKFN